MKRRIEVRAGKVLKVVALLSTDGQCLTRQEIERIRDDLADRLVEAVAGLPYLGTRKHRVRVT